MNNVLPTLLVTALMFGLTGCSSPPKPVAVDFKTVPEAVNPHLPRLLFTKGSFTSARAEGPWSLESKGFKGDKGSYDAAFYYALIHADLIELDFQDATKGEHARQWLMRHGATATIQAKAQLSSSLLRPCNNAVSRPGTVTRSAVWRVECDNTSITFYKYGGVKK